MTINLWINVPNILKYHTWSLHYRNEHCRSTLREDCHVVFRRVFRGNLPELGLPNTTDSIWASLKRYKFGHSVA